ncbi:putative E3 ubiquitin-protein ligase RING1a [Malania oleifera]|uniref:putative E3 ubiquitin-protein ligase RING1a n=1 Tax=Malania oleifera TaxID=397392 RepID=UPI0025ADFDF9|nr:putative E3 ubiquitin-protein ligase RING1a [Malania oleifera]
MHRNLVKQRARPRSLSLAAQKNRTRKLRRRNHTILSSPLDFSSVVLAMPAQKRACEAEDDHPLLFNHNDGQHEQAEDGDESDRSPSPSSGDKDEFIIVKLAEIRKEVQCPICLGIIRKTRTVMECLHRFCRECIDKSMRLGNNECPACRTHCASRRSLRDDPNYDALIAALYPDIDKYEEEELAFHEEEKARNKQIQASIAQTLRRQAEALGRKRTTAKATAAAFVRRPLCIYRSAPLRGRRNYHAAELQGSDDDEDGNGHDGSKDSSSADELSELKPKRCKRWGGARFSQPSTADGGDDENESEVIRDSMGLSAGLVCNSEMLAWGRGGMRSHTRYGSSNGGNGRNARIGRLSKLVDRLRNLEDSNDELDTHLVLVSFDEQRIPNLQRPYLSCRPNLSIRHLCQYISLQTALQADEVEILAVRGHHPRLNLNYSTSISNSIIDSCKDALQILEAQETLAGLTSSCFNQGQLLLVYRRKLLD